MLMPLLEYGYLELSTFNLYIITFIMTLGAPQKITYKNLKENRRYFYLGILFVCACLTESPHYVSQLKAAIPAMLVFELLIVLMAKFRIVIFHNFKD